MEAADIVVEQEDFNDDEDDLNLSATFITFISMGLSVSYLYRMTDTQIAIPLVYIMYRKLRMGIQFGRADFATYMVHEAPLIYAEYGIYANKHAIFCLFFLVFDMWHRDGGNINIRMFCFFCAISTILVLEFFAFQMGYDVFDYPQSTSTIPKATQDTAIIIRYYA